MRKLNQNNQKQLKLYQNFIFNPKWYKTFALGLFAFLCAYVVAGTFTPVQSSDAQEVTIHNSASGYYVTITNSDDLTLNVDATPIGSIATANDTVNVKTNAPTGYQLYVSASSSNIYNSTDTSHSQPYLSPVTGTLDDKKALGQNTWGFSLDDASTMELASTAIWSGVPDTSTTLISETSGPEYATGVNTQIYYGVNANTTLPAGNYSTTIFYTALAEGVTTPFMQDFTNAECAAMETDTTMKLMDSRNAAIYNIVKARDGNCWMADNLAISDTTITAADSNINSGSFYIPASSEWSTNDYSQALVHVAANTGYEGEHYYNWYAATAGATPTTDTSNVTTSICPKGWRLPENSTATGAKSWYNLITSYSVATGAQLLDSSNDAYTLGIHGYYGRWDFTGPIESHQGSYGHFWTSTSQTGVWAHSLDYGQSSITYGSAAYTNKGNGFNVRCVFGDSRTLQDITYMQDINTNICQNTATATSAADIKQLKDNRGKGNNGSDKTGTYGVVKAADGNCWMTDNLNLYNTTTALTPANTDIPSGTYTIPASSNWNTSIYTEPKLHVANGTGSYADKTGTYYGTVYYSWTAAVALIDGSTTAQQDQSICPKGFTLPSRSNGILKNLMDSYNVTNGNELLDVSDSAYILGYHLYYGAWSAPNNSEAFQGPGGVGGIMTSSPNSSSASQYYTFDYTTSKAAYTEHGKGEYAYIVRCVSR